MKTLLLSSIASLALAVPALADNVTLSIPGAAYTLTTGNVDLVAYHTDLGDGGYEVTAFSRARDSYSQPEQVKMRLEDQDSVSFAMPAEPRVIYTFARTADVVTISSEQIPMEFASN